MNSAAVELSIVIATYNERENIGRCIEAVNSICRRNKINNEIIVVDDNSPDKTADIVEAYNKIYKNIILFNRPAKLGIGSAHEDGISVSHGKVIIAMDPDFSHPPDKIPMMYKLAKQGYMVSGSRFICKNGFKTLFYRKIGTTILNKWITLLFNLGIDDFSNGFVAIKKGYVESILQFGKKMKINPYNFVLWGIPLLILGNKLGYKSVSIFAPYIFRMQGKTKINFAKGIKIWVISFFLVNKLFIKLFYKQYAEQI